MRLPAILMHDVGWKKFPEDNSYSAVGPNPKSSRIVTRHEIEGAKITAEVLAKLAIPVLARTHLAIIDGHDTRKAARHSLNDAVMKDADKLWRFTRMASP